MMILFSKPGCPFVQRVKIALGFKRVPVEEWQIDPAHPPREFRRVAPVGRVPVLLDGAVPIRESNAILEYLEDRFPHPPLMPDDWALRARVREVMIHDSSSVVPAFYGLMHATTVAGKAWARERLNATLRALEALTGPASDAYLVDKVPTLADVAVYPHLQRYRLLQEFRGAPPLTPRVRAWLAAMERHAAVSSSSPGEEVLRDDLLPYLEGARVYSTAA